MSECLSLYWARLILGSLVILGLVSKTTLCLPLGGGGPNASLSAPSEHHLYKVPNVNPSVIFSTCFLLLFFEIVNLYTSG